MAQPRRMELARLSWLAWIAFSATACALVWDLKEPPPEPSDNEASADASSPADDATVDSAELDAPDGTVDAGYEGDASNAEASDAHDAALDEACTTCGETYCVNLTSNQFHCGDCKTACTGVDSHCVGGHCLCAAGTHQCGSACIPESSASCGPSCTVCPRPPGVAGLACPNGKCAPTCAVGLALCKGDTLDYACVDTTSDPANCSDCGHVCPFPDGGMGFACRASKCVLDCKTGLSPCPTTNPTACVDLNGDPQNCLTCGTVCPPVGGVPGVCTGGTCH